MGEPITAKDKEYEERERAAAPGADQSMSDRVNNRSLRPRSEAFKEFMRSGWADDEPDIERLESAAFTPARLRALGAAFPGDRLVVPAGTPKVRNNDCDYMFRPDTTFAYYTGLGVDYEAGAVLVLNPVDPSSPEAAAGETHTAQLFVAPRADNSTTDFFMNAHYGEYWVGPRAGLKEMTAMTGIETHDIAQLADALSKDVGAGAGAVRVRVVRETDPQVTALVESIRRSNGFADPESNEADDDRLHEFAAEARMCKDAYEVGEMRKAVDATKAGFDRLLTALPDALDKPRSERVLEGAFNSVSKINVEAGPRMAGSDYFKITVQGRSGHGSQPNQALDAVVISAAIIMNLQTVVSRHYNPLESVVLTVGSVLSGNRFNIIAGDAVMEGTTRYFKPEIGPDLEKTMRRIVESTAEAYGATAKLEYKYVVPVTSNYEEPTEVARQAVKEVLGEDALAPMRMTAGGEDFSFYLQHKPGCFVFPGIYNEDPKFDATHSHHSHNFNMDDTYLSGASGVYAQTAMDWLKKHNK